MWIACYFLGRHVPVPLTDRCPVSKDEHDYLLRIVRGEDPLFEGNPPHLDITAYLYFQLAVLNPEIRPDLKKRIGPSFDNLIRQRLRAVIPALIERFRTAPMLAAIENDLTLIVRGCEIFTMDVAEFIPRQELLPLARAAFIRSVAAFKKEYGTQQPARLMYACAAGMGISAEEMGFKPQFVEDCIDKQLYRNDPNPKLAQSWTRHLENRRYLEQALA
jgi:hypothetical protein